MSSLTESFGQRKLHLNYGSGEVSRFFVLSWLSMYWWITSIGEQPELKISKVKKKIALCHEKIANTRKDYLHKLSHEIISENQVIVSENLQVKNMVKNHRLAKSISNVSWYELTRQLEYKGEWNKRKYIKINMFYASSQLCSVCGYQNTETKNLSVRKWACPVCGAEHDRDINAAKNILAEGLRQIA